MTLLRKLWDALASPAQAMTSPTDRREARLLSSVLLLIFAISLAAVWLARLPFTPPARLSSASVLALFVALGTAYGLSRTRYIRAAIVFSIAVLSLSPFAIALFGLHPPDIGRLDYLLVSVLVAGLFVPIRTTAILVALMALAMALIPLLEPSVSLPTVVTGPMVFVLLAAGVHLLARNYHSRLNRQRLQELFEIEHRYRALSEASDDGIAILDLEGRCLSANKRLADMLGSAGASLVDQPFENLIAPEEAPNVAPLLTALRQGEVLPPQECTLLTPDGDLLPVEISASIVHNDSGDPSYVQLIVRDISIRRAEREALQRRHRGLMVLNRIISATTTTVDNTQMLRALCGELAYAFGLRHVYAAHIDRHTSVAVVTADYASAGVNRLLGASLPLDTPIIAHVLIYRTILFVESPRTDSRMGIWERSLPKDRQVSLLLVPLLVRDRVVSILGMELPIPNPLSAQDVELIQSSASAVAQALETAELYRRLEQRADELEEMVKHRTLELQDALDQAQAADRAKSQFVSNVSHELRTPLTSIRLYIDLVNRGKPERIKAYVAALTRETARLQHLVESLLMISRLDLGTIQLDVHEMDLNDAVTTLVSDRQTLFGDRNLTLSVEIEPTLTPLRADPRLIEQVITNLLTNAMNYTPEGGAVTLRTGTAEVEGRRWATISIEDTGLGIAAEERARLFRRFERGQASTALHVPGTGLGLAISKEIIDLHRGRINVDSALGRGSTFIVWLPLDAHSRDEETADTRPLEA